MSEPSTEAGRALPRFLFPKMSPVHLPKIKEMIVAIEAEARAGATEETPAGFVRCPLCHDIERVEDMVGGVCLTCADGIAWSQNARRAAVVVPVPTKVCPICNRTIERESHGGPHPSAGDHDPAPHVAAAYGTGGTP